MTRALAPVLVFALFVACVPSRCQTPPGPSPATGGVPATGGTPGTGGVEPATGGQETGGAATGGAPEPSTADLLCEHLADIGCAEGDGSCVVQAQALLDLQAEGRARFDVVCLSEATTPAQAQGCGSILCGGAQ
jgi:hypothetical protein